MLALVSPARVGAQAAEKTADAWEGATESVRRFNDEAGKGEFSTNTRGEVITTGTDVQRLAAQNSTSPEGAKLFEELNCISCHRAGSNQRGPVLEGLYGKPVDLKGGATVIADDAYIRESIVNPTAKVVNGFEPLMPV